MLEKSPFYEISCKYNVDVCYRPFIKVQGVTLKEFRSQRVELLDYSAVIFTSRTTINNFFRICEEARITVPESMKYFCNTEAVALYLQKYIVYRKRKIFFADGSFNNFMELIIKHKEEKFVLTLSEPHSPEIPQTMERLKFRFAPVILAKTVSNDLSDINMADYDLAAFYSPTEIATLVASFGTESLPLLATFGDGTTRAAVQAGLPVSTMAPRPEAPSLVRAIELLLDDICNGQQINPIVIDGARKSEEFIKAQEAKPVKKTRAKRKTATAAATKTTSAAAKTATAAKSSTAVKATVRKSIDSTDAKSVKKIV